MEISTDLSILTMRHFRCHEANSPTKSTVCRKKIVNIKSRFHFVSPVRITVSESSSKTKVDQLEAELVVWVNLIK